MSVEKAIVNILEGNLDEMRKNFSVSLSEKAIMKLDEKKVEIGQKYFGQTKKLSKKD
jgi:restriction endonuclease S subunit